MNQKEYEITGRLGYFPKTPSTPTNVEMITKEGVEQLIFSCIEIDISEAVFSELPSLHPPSQLCVVSQRCYFQYQLIGERFRGSQSVD